MCSVETVVKAYLAKSIQLKPARRNGVHYGCVMYHCDFDTLFVCSQHQIRVRRGTKRVTNNTERHIIRGGIF